MTNFERSFGELLDSLSMAQISIEQTTSYALNHPNKFDLVLKLWQKFLNRANVEKSICLLYLANDIIHRIRDKSAREKFAQCLINNIDYLTSNKIKPTLVRVVKIWAERKVFPHEIMKKFKHLISNVDGVELEDLSISRLFGYLNIYHEMNNALNMYKSNADPLVEELWRLSKLKNFDLIKKYLPQIEKTASKCKYQLEEIREAVLNCKLQSSHINEYRKYYEKIYNNATTSLEKYSDFRGRIIQLRWKVEKVKQTIVEIKCKKQVNPDFSKDSHDIADMEVDSQHDSEIDNKSITLPSPTPTPTSNPHVFPSQQPFFENPYIVFPSQVDYFPINLPLSYEGYITPTPPVTGYTKQAQSLEFLSTCTVVDYNHGINENPDQSTDFPPYDDYQNPNIHLYSQQQDDNPTFLPPLFRDDCEYPHNHHRTQFYPE